MASGKIVAFIYAFVMLIAIITTVESVVGGQFVSLNREKRQLFGPNNGYRTYDRGYNRGGSFGRGSFARGNSGGRRNRSYG